MMQTNAPDFLQWFNGGAHVVLLLLVIEMRVKIGVMWRDFLQRRKL